MGGELLDGLKFWVGVTDKHWFNYLASIKPDEVNFWQPGGNTNFRALEPGELFLFKLRSPDNYIVGGGWFVSHSFLPVSVACEAFGEKNGTQNYAQLRTKILGFRQDRAAPDPTIGCIVLAKPFFFPKDRWINTPGDWSSNIVRGKTYSLDDPNGDALWKEVTVRLSEIEAQPIRGQEGDLLVSTPAIYGRQYLTHARLGQGAFRVEVSQRIKAEFENGRDYYALHGKSLANLPNSPDWQPAREFIEWHNENVYVG